MRFCKNCGKRVEDDERFCGHCGTQQPPMRTQSLWLMEQETAQSAEPVQMIDEPMPGNAGADQITQYEAQIYMQDSPKKKKKKWIMIGAIAGAVAVLAAVFFIFILPMFGGGGTADVSAVFSNGGNDYYASPYLFKLNGSGAPDMVKHSGDERDGRSAAVVYTRAAKSGSTIYQVDGSMDPDKRVVKLELTSSNTVRQSLWVEPDVLKNCVFGDPDDEYSKWVTGITHLQTDGKNAYFVIDPQPEYATTQWNIRGKMGRISTDGKTIEEIGGINARDFVLDGDKIYFYDDGYTCSGDNKPGTRSTENIGIYQAKTDGSAKKLLHAFTLSEDQKEEFGNYSLDVCGAMKMIGGKLYFLDYTAEGKGRLCRMDTGGGNVEYLSDSAVKSYTIDTDHNTAYYETAEFDEEDGYSTQDQASPKMAKYEIGAHRESEIPYKGPSASEMSYYQGYLYFVCYSAQASGDGSMCGMRIDTNAGKVEKLIYHDESKTEFNMNPQTGKPEIKRTEGKQYLTWETVEIN